MPRRGRRGGVGRGRPAARRTTRRMTRRRVHRMRRRRRRRRILLIGGMVAVGYAGYKMSKKDVERVEEYTGSSADELTDEQLEQAMDQLGIDKETMSDEEWAQAESADAQGSYLDELERLAQLNQQGIITDDEFAAKKSKLLGL